MAKVVLVSGMLRGFLEEGAPADVFAVGSYISDTKPVDFTADLHEVEGRPIAKRGRMPGITPFRSFSQKLPIYFT